MTGMDQASSRTDVLPSETDAATSPRRLLYLSLGWIFVALGFAGALLPLLPTTPFMLLAAWAFSKSSRRFEAWLLNHRLFGPSIVRWRAHRIIPAKAKAISLSVMSVTFAWSLMSGRIPWWGLLAQGLLMGYGAWFVLRCPSQAPSEGISGDGS